MVENKQMLIRDKLYEMFGTHDWTFTSEFDGRKWQFLVEYKPSDVPTEQEETKMKEIVRSIEPNSSVYVLAASSY